MVLNHSLGSEQDFLPDLRQRVSTLPQNCPFKPSYAKDSEHTKCYDLYELAVARLKKGIEVIKYNYSNMHKKNVVLKLSDDEKWLMYEPIDK